MLMSACQARAVIIINQRKRHKHESLTGEGDTMCGLASDLSKYEANVGGVYRIIFERARRMLIAQNRRRADPLQLKMHLFVKM